MSQPTQKSTGPVFVWVTYPQFAGSRGAQRQGTLVGPVFLGTCEINPIQESEPVWEPVLNDFGGAVPFDQNYQGAMETLVCDLNRFDERVFNAVAAAPTTFGIPGTDTFLSRGSFLGQGGNGVQVWFQYSFFGTSNAQADLGPGWYYPNCKVAGVYTPKQGTRPQLRRMIFEANNLFSINSGVWSFTYKSNNPAAFAPINSLTPT